MTDTRPLQDQRAVAFKAHTGLGANRYLSYINPFWKDKKQKGRERGKTKALSLETADELIARSIDPSHH